MNQKTDLINKLNDIILQFEESTQIENYAIRIRDRIILSPNPTHLTVEKVLDILDKLNVEEIEGIFQRGFANLIYFEFEDELIYYFRVMLDVNIIVVPEKDKVAGAREKLLVFVKQIKSVVEPLSNLPSEEEVKIQQVLDELDTLVNEFTVPKFERFKNLVKFAIPFKKKE